MLHEQTEGTPLHDLGTAVFELIAQLTGAPPALREEGTWYRADWRDQAFLWVTFRGERATKYKQNSVLLRTYWDDAFEGWADRTNDLPGNTPTASYFARPEVPEELSNADRFIRLALANAQR